MKLLLLIALILIIFCILWLVIWSWFFKLNNESFNRLQEIGLRAFEKGNYQKAKNLILRALDKKNDAELKTQLILSHMNLKEYKEAQSILEQISKESPNDTKTMLQLAQVLEKQQKFKEALEICSKILQKEPKDIDCLTLIAEIHYKQADCEKALETVKSIEDIEPENSSAKIIYLKCQSEKCDPENVEEYEKILNELINFAQSNDFPAETNIIFAKMYAKNGELEKALESSQKAVEKCPDDVESYQILGLIHLIQKDFAKAKETLNKALEFDSKNKETHNLFSYVLCQQVDNCPLNACREKYYKLIEKYLK